MEQRRQRHILFRIILATLLFSSAIQQELIVFCVNNNNVLYKQVMTINETTTAYPISDNISNIAF